MRSDLRGQDSLSDDDVYDIDNENWQNLRGAVSGEVHFYSRDPRELYSFADGDLLGEGSFGDVYRATLRSVPLRLGKVPVLGRGRSADEEEDMDARSAPSLIAMKLYWKNSMSPQDVSRTIREVEIMSRCEHVGICRLKGVFETPELVALSCELCEGGELFDRLLKAKAFPEHVAAPIFTQILRAVAYLHSCCIVHRDLKLENIMFSRPELDSPVKLVDFGFARYAASDEDLLTPCGTADYVAPEIAKREGHGYQRQVDAWSLGVVLYVMLCGFPPFVAAEDSDLLRVIAQGKYGFPVRYWSHISDEAKSLVASLLEVNPSTRITPQQALEHVWLRRYASLSTEAPTVLAAPSCPQSTSSTHPGEAHLRKSLLMAEHVLETKRDENMLILRSASESALYKKRQEKRTSSDIATPANSASHKLSRSDELIQPSTISSSPRKIPNFLSSVESRISSQPPIEISPHLTSANL